jgi:uncharacterized membrane protein YccC
MSRKEKKDEPVAKEQDSGISLATHPVASEQIRLAKGFGGLFGLVAVAWVTWDGGASLATVGIRALAAGLVGYVLAWAFTLSLWRHIAVADIQQKRKKAEEAYRSHLEEQDDGDDGADLAIPAA